MRKSVLILLTFFTLFLSAKETMKIVYFYDFKPFSWESEDGKMNGILIDIMNEALIKRMKIDVSHSGYPWARAQKLVKFEKADAFITVPTALRREYTKISSEPVIVSKFSIFTHKDNPRIKSLNEVKSLKELQKFSLIHYLGSGWAKDNLKGMDVFWESNMKKALRHLSLGRYDVFIDVSQVISYNIKELGYKDTIVEIPNVLDSKPFNLCIGKNSQFVKILPEFEKTIKQMREDGTLKKIYEKYK